jgi:hypothetical protein
MKRCTAVSLASGVALVCLLASKARAQGWRPLDVARLPARDVLRVVESDGGVLEAAGDRIIRRRDGVARELVCTARAGTGTIRALALGPLGTTYVAAERGLFLVDPSVDALDGMWLADGVPRGEIVGLHSDRVDRLWIATRDEFGCVHTGQWFGRMHTHDDGLPAPPYLEFAPASGELLLRTAAGVFAYRPDPTPPDLQEVRVVGGPISAPTGSRVECYLRAVAEGGASYRWRAASEHMLREVRAGSIDLAYPGTHALTIHAFDRDLDRSVALPLSVHVPYEEVYDPRRLLPAIVAIAVSVLVGFVARAIRSKRPIGKALLDACLVLVVATQLLAAVLGHGRSYPFIGFAMYRDVSREDDVVYTPLVQARDRNGVWHEIPAGPLSFTTDGTWRHLAELLYADENERDAFLRERASALGSPWTAFELRIARCRLTAEGPTAVAPFVLDRHDAVQTAREEPAHEAR